MERNMSCLHEISKYYILIVDIAIKLCFISHQYTTIKLPFDQLKFGLAILENGYMEWVDIYFILVNVDHFLPLV